MNGQLLEECCFEVSHSHLNFGHARYFFLSFFHFTCGQSVKKKLNLVSSRKAHDILLTYYTYYYETHTAN